MTEHRPCALCLKLRFFLTIAAALIAGLFFQPDWGVSLAAYMPSAMVIGAAICACGALTFLLRYAAYRRSSSGFDGDTTTIRSGFDRHPAQKAQDTP